ncbi:MAG: hypothetical protein WKG32_12305 [Gemmatimonadaceae bacterium]
MILRSRFGRACAALAVLAVAGCSDGGSGPEDDFSGTYLLTSVNGQFPFTVAVSGFPPPTQFKVVSGHMRMASRGRVIDVVDYQSFPGTGAPGALAPDSGAFAFTRSGNRILIQRPGAVPADNWVDTALIDQGRFISLTRRLRANTGLRPSGRFVAVYEKP